MSTRTPGRPLRTALRCLALFALLALPLPVLAQVVNPVWTAVASTGTIDEANYTPVNFAFGTTNLGFLGGNFGAIVARYNVTNINGAMNPPWNFLELGAIDTSNMAGNQVVASLYQVNPCTGAQVLLCSTTSVLTGAAGVCTTCQFAGPIDFIQFLYYVEVKVSRTAAGINEQALTLRIY